MQVIKINTLFCVINSKLIEYCIHVPFPLRLIIINVEAWNIIMWFSLILTNLESTAVIRLNNYSLPLYSAPSDRKHYGLSLRYHD